MQHPFVRHGLFQQANCRGVAFEWLVGEGVNLKDSDWHSISSVLAMVRFLAGLYAGNRWASVNNNQKRAKYNQIRQPMYGGKLMKVQNFAKLFDHSVVKPNATRDEVRFFAETAARLGTAR
jgi:hypothetical protein